MKKLLTLISLILFLSCAQDEIIITEVSIDVPETLKIKELVGIKTESIIVEEEVRMNVKLPYTGLYRIKLIDIEGTLISQEKIEVKEGDNLLKVYVNTLPKSSYILRLTDNNHEVLGVESIVVQ